jgi:hypothetical protein
MDPYKKGFSWEKPMFHQVSKTGERRNREVHMGDVWQHPQILGKFKGDIGVPSIGVPISKIIKIKIIMIKSQQ